MSHFGWSSAPRSSNSSSKSKSPADLLAAKKRGKPSYPTPPSSLVKKSSQLGKIFGWNNSAQQAPPAARKRERQTTVDVSDLSPDQKRVLDAVKEGQNVFFTGSAGTGKSFTMQRVIAVLKELYESSTVHVTASTGVAATHIGGTTLHSFAGVGLGNEPADELVKKIQKQRSTRDRWEQATVLVVDEISMVSADFFCKLEKIGRAIRGNERPFGGLQIVLSGDFLQLPPVDQSQGRFIFDTDAWKSVIHQTIELRKVFRQKEEAFVALLQSLRKGKVSDEEDAILRSRLTNAPTTRTGVLKAIAPTKLYSHRADVDAENAVQLRTLPGEARVFQSKDTGNKEQGEKNFLVPARLELKIGAQVILLKNLDPPTLVNGSRGVVVGFEKPSEATMGTDDRFGNGLGRQGIDLNTEYPMVLFDSGTTRLCFPEQWNLERGTELIAGRLQIPLMLGWCLSIHKSQGMTIANIETDISNCWDPGQAYVALSRATSLEGLRLLGYRRDRIRAHPRVLQFYEEMEQKARARDARDATTPLLTEVTNLEVAKKARTESSSSWKCQMCTLNNALDLATCEVCGEMRPMRLIHKLEDCLPVPQLEVEPLETTPLPPKEILYWQCEQCTHFNDEDIPQCCVCGEVPEIVVLIPRRG